MILLLGIITEKKKQSKAPNIVWNNVAAMRDIVFQVDFLARMLLFHLVLALVIILEVGASRLLMNSDAHYMGTFLVSNNKNNLIMSIGMTWRKRRNRWKKRNWRPVFNQLPASLPLSLSLSKEAQDVGKRKGMQRRRISSFRYKAIHQIHIA
ncbi:hypothetical protein AMTRI_Chr10g8570 [Amborella trichopoda]